METGSRRRRGWDVEIPWRRVAGGWDVEIPLRRVAGGWDVWIFRGDDAAAPRQLVRRDGGAGAAAVWGWHLNPIAIALCTRGSWDCAVAGLAVFALLAAKRSRWFRAGGLVGAAAHLRLYPVIYGPAFAWRAWKTAGVRGVAALGLGFVLGAAPPTVLAYVAHGDAYFYRADSLRTSRGGAAAAT